MSLLKQILASSMAGTYWMLYTRALEIYCVKIYKSRGIFSSAKNIFIFGARSLLLKSSFNTRGIFALGSENVSKNEAAIKIKIYFCLFNFAVVWRNRKD